MRRRRRGTGRGEEGGERGGGDYCSCALPPSLASSPHSQWNPGDCATGQGWRAERVLPLRSSPMESSQKSSEGGVLNGNSLREEKREHRSE